MREIKFRAWSKRKKKWYIPFLHDSFVFEDGREMVDGITTDDPILQYTGLKDKNGFKDIYDGDIDKSTGFYVGWNQLHCCCGLFDKNGFKKEIMADEYHSDGTKKSVWQSDSIEVIGNIYENPELLESK